MCPYSQVNLDRMALQLALPKTNPRWLYSPKMVLDLGSFSLVERRPASLEKHPKPITSTTSGMQTQPNSSHFLSLVLCFLFSATKAAEPAIMLASSKTLVCSVDVTDKSKAAGLPRSQLGTRTSAGRDWELDPAPQPISRRGPRQARWQE